MYAAAEEDHMIEKLTMDFFRRYPDLASAMIGWNFLDCMKMLVIALIPITLKNDGIRWSLLIECLIVKNTPESFWGFFML